MKIVMHCHDKTRRKPNQCRSATMTRSSGGSHKTKQVKFKSSDDDIGGTECRTEVGDLTPVSLKGTHYELSPASENNGTPASTKTGVLELPIDSSTACIRSILSPVGRKKI
jgi:hypothetical protein